MSAGRDKGKKYPTCGWGKVGQGGGKREPDKRKRETKTEVGGGQKETAGQSPGEVAVGKQLTGQDKGISLGKNHPKKSLAS